MLKLALLVLRFFGAFTSIILISLDFKRILSRTQVINLNFKFKIFWPILNTVRVTSKRVKRAMIVSVNLENIPFFRHIPKELISKISERFSIQSYEPGVRIITFGSIVDSLYLVIQGKADVLTHDGLEKIASLGFGAAVGETSFFMPYKSATAHVIASQEGVSLLVMPKVILETEILSDSFMAASFYKGMCSVMAERLSGTNLLVSDKLAHFKDKIRKFLGDKDLITKFKSTKKSVEVLGVDIFQTLAEALKLLDHKSDQEPKVIMEKMEQVQKSVERVLLKDLQNIDFIAQKIDLIIQYLDNLEKSLQDQDPNDLKGDLEIFTKSM